MKQTFKKYISQVSLLVAGVLVATGLSIANAAGVWTAPTATPPNGNVDAPINVGASSQTKLGELRIMNSFYSQGAVIDGTIAILGGNPAAGKVLVSDADGLASWVDPGDIDPVECVGEGLIHVANNGGVEDSGNNRTDDDFETYCRKGVARFCVSGENCPWRTGIRSADNLVCASNMNWDSNAAKNPQNSTQYQLAHVQTGNGWRGYNYFFCSKDGTSKDAYYAPDHPLTGQNNVKVR